jgi:hypothetical protein
MKTKSFLVITGLLLAAASYGAPLMETTAIHSQPDTSSPAISYLKAGTDPIATPGISAPAGWMAVEMPGPHEAYVNNDDFSKSLEIRAGAAIRLKPNAGAPLLATMQEGDKTEITGLRNGWTQIKLSRTVIGYVHIGGSASLPATAPAAAASAPPPPPTTLAPPAGAGPATSLPRTLQGMLVETKRFLFVGRRPGYDYQLNDTEGKRIAFLDVSKVSATEKIEPFVDRLVTVSGIIKETSDWKNLVIAVQTLEAR